MEKTQNVETQQYATKRNTLTNIENKLVVTSGEREGRRGNIGGGE